MSHFDFESKYYLGELGIQVLLVSGQVDDDGFDQVSARIQKIEVLHAGEAIDVTSVLTPEGRAGMELDMVTRYVDFHSQRSSYSNGRGR